LKLSGLDFKECWFNLVQKSINVAAQTFDSAEDFMALKEMDNKYVKKQVVEKYLRE